MSAPDAPTCVYGRWRPEGEHQAVDPVVLTQVPTVQIGCRACVPAGFNATGKERS